MKSPLRLQRGVRILANLGAATGKGGRRLGFVPVPGSIANRRSPAVWTAGALGLGATAMYFLDPQSGARRRARLRNKAFHTAKQSARIMGKGVRDARNRGRGLLARLRIRPSDADDEVLLARVRSELGHHVTHSKSVDVMVHDGVVTLRGPILTDEVRELLRATRRISGVHSVRSELEPHVEPGSVPGLQGDGTGSAWVRDADRWSPAFRIAAGGAGLAAGAYGLFRGGLAGFTAATFGGMVLARALSDRPLRKIVGIRTGPEVVVVTKTTTVDVPVNRVYELWSRFENLATFMAHVEQITVEEDRRLSRWRVRGPAGTHFEWNAELLEDEPNERLSWRTISGRIQHRGTARFEALGPEQTRVTVDMTYSPPAGVLGHKLAGMLGHDPKAALDEDMLRMKSLLEEGHTTVDGHEVRLTELH